VRDSSAAEVGAGDGDCAEQTRSASGIRESLKARSYRDGFWKRTWLLKKHGSR